MLRIGPVAVCLAILLSACGESTIKAQPTEQMITRLVFKQTGFRPTDMRCPSGVPAKVGTKFECHFTGPDGRYTAYVRILSVHGERVVNQIVTRRTGNPRPG